MQLRMSIVLVLCALMVQSAQAQAAEITSTAFVPLEVGNQWTYKHTYVNKSDYFGATEPRVLYEIPESENHHADYLGRIELDSEFTIEITHTEWIEGSEYFVFSRAAYDWPPVPAVFWAGQKVRLSDEGVLLFRWNGEDIPLYDFNPQHPNDYSIPAYPLGEDVSTKLDISRKGTTFELAYPELDPELDNRGWGVSIFREVDFIDGRGPTYWEIHSNIGGFCLPSESNPTSPASASANEDSFCFVESHAFFANILSLVSVSYSSDKTNVQPSSWGQLKDRFVPSSPFIR